MDSAVLTTALPFSGRRLSRSLEAQEGRTSCGTRGPCSTWKRETPVRYIVKNFQAVTAEHETTRGPRGTAPGDGHRGKWKTRPAPREAEGWDGRPAVVIAGVPWEATNFRMVPPTLHFWLGEQRCLPKNANFITALKTFQRRNDGCRSFMWPPLVVLGRQVGEAAFSVLRVSTPWGVPSTHCVRGVSTTGNRSPVPKRLKRQEAHVLTAAGVRN